MDFSVYYGFTHELFLFEDKNFQKLFPCIKTVLNIVLWYEGVRSMKFESALRKE